MIEEYLKVLELGYLEVTFAFEGLSDENVWKRPADGLLSIGEQAGHIAYWEAVRLAGDDKLESDGTKGDLSRCRVSSPLIDHRFRYYSATIPTPPSPEHLSMTAQQVCRELVRVHEASVADFRGRKPELTTDDDTEFLRYLAFHVAYHTGQMYTVRHLLGDTTTDN
ncbi:MAG: DinB family protein [Armatimonadota bacterium]